MAVKLRNFCGLLSSFRERCQQFNGRVNIKKMSHALPSKRDSSISKANGKVFESLSDAVWDIGDGSKLMIGGFGPCGSPDNLLEAIMNRGCKDLTVVSNDVEKYALQSLLREGRIKRLICSYIGQNAEVEKQYFAGQLEMEMSPQGTLAERIRAGGSGIPGFYTPAGFATDIQKGNWIVKYDLQGNPKIFDDLKIVATFDGRSYVLERALNADFGIVKAWKADESGNLIFRKTARNFNPVMCKASKLTIVEAEEIVDIGELEPDQIHVPGIYVDRIVQAEIKDKSEQGNAFKNGAPIPINEARKRIVSRAVLEFKDGMTVNVGVGMPTLAVNFIPEGTKVMVQSENGLLGVGPSPIDGQIYQIDLMNAGDDHVTIVPGASFFGSDESFGMIRGGHIDMTILGALQVSEKGDLANWLIPGKKVSGMGGAMDLVSTGKTRVVVTMEHKTRDGSPKILEKCSFPITGQQCVDLIITDLAVFEVRKDKGLRLIEIAPETSVQEVVRSTQCKFEVADDLKIMGQVEINP